jgi:ABC-type amino acid transport substrate-binding protein
MNRWTRALLLLLLPLIVAGCTHLHPKAKALFSSVTGPEKLRVGIAVDAPPLAYKKDEILTGLEPKFAAGLARATGKTLELVELPRQELARALRENKIDIIMSGLTATSAQGRNLALSTPYLASGQVTLVHLDDFKQLGNGTRNLAGPKVRLGVVAGSIGESLVNGLKPQGTTTRFASAPEGVQALINDTIDAFVHDLPANFYYAALYVDQGLTPGVTPMTSEQLVWAVRPDDPNLLKAANDYLAAIRQSGELNALLERSIPFYRNTSYSPKK